VQMRGGRAGFIGRRARLARHHGARRVIMACHACTCHVAILSFHASPPPNPPRFLRAYPFLTRFSRAVLEVFWCSKWVMHHIVGNLSTSSFQRYKVCANRSSDERVMAPGSHNFLYRFFSLIKEGIIITYKLFKHEALNYSISSLF
jgi:hypothetical protein